MAPSIAPSDSSDTEPENHPRPVPQRTRSSGFDSPLARLFGGGSTKRTKKVRKESVKDKVKAKSNDEKRSALMSDSTVSLAGPSSSGESEVERLKKELADVRESQLRMEDMLTKLLSPAGQDK